MRKWVIICIFLCCMVLPVSAMEFTAPVAPEAAQPYMPEDTESFGEGLWYILKTAISYIKPEIADASGICLSVIAVVLLMSILSTLTQSGSDVVRLTGSVVIGIMLLEPANTFIRLGASTIIQIGEYGKLLLPIMTAAVAAQGGTSTSTVLYTGTAFFDTLLTMLITKIIVPLLYIYLCLCVAESAIGLDTLKKIRDFSKSIMVRCLKYIIYIFTGYISLTGIISGVADKSALKMVKMTIAGVVPVVGNILSDASETVLLSAGVMKSTAGIYGIFTILALCINPFLEIGVLYLMLKLSAAVCNVFAYKPVITLVQDFTDGMGLILAMIGTSCLLLLISLVCLMRGIGL